MLGFLFGLFLQEKKINVPFCPLSILKIGAKFKNFLDSDSLRTENIGEIRFLSPPIVYSLRQGTEPSYEMEEKCGFPEKPSE